MAGDPAYIRNLKAFTRGDISIEDLTALEAELYGTNDRASAIILGSIVEASLTTFLRRQLRSDLSSDDRRYLFDYEGPIGTFASKTMLAYGLGKIGQITRHDLDLIRLIRNEFAHSRRHFGFHTSVVAQVCRHLKAPDFADAFIPSVSVGQAPPAGLAATSDKDHPRTRYHSACHTISERLLKNVSTLRRVTGSGIEPKPPLP